jgi:hypothetical protein
VEIRHESGTGIIFAAEPVIRVAPSRLSTRNAYRVVISRAASLAFVSDKTDETRARVSRERQLATRASSPAGRAIESKQRIGSASDKGRKCINQPAIER